MFAWRFFLQKWELRFVFDEERTGLSRSEMLATSRRLIRRAWVLGSHVSAALRLPVLSRPMSQRNPAADAFVNAWRNVPTSLAGGWALDMTFLAARCPSAKLTVQYSQYLQKRMPTWH